MNVEQEFYCILTQWHEHTTVHICIFDPFLCCLFTFKGKLNFPCSLRALATIENTLFHCLLKFILLEVLMYGMRWATTLSRDPPCSKRSACEFQPACTPVWHSTTQPNTHLKESCCRAKQVPPLPFDLGLSQHVSVFTSFLSFFPCSHGPHPK